MRYPVNQLCYLGGILLCFLALAELIRLLAILPRSRKTTATITRIRPLTPDDLHAKASSAAHSAKKKGDMAFVTYRVDGRNYFSKTEIPVPAGKEVGSRIPVWYARLFPDTLLPKPSCAKLLLLTVLSLLLFLAGFLL
nr:hypothetical protein [uncultured Eisenbergiella sp.]